MTVQKLIHILILLISTYSLLSCAPVTNINGLSVVTSQQQLFLSNITYDTCSATNINTPTSDSGIKPISFSLPGITLSWTNSKTLTLNNITFTLTSPSLVSPFSCSFGGTDLMKTWVHWFGALDATSGTALAGSQAQPLALTFTIATKAKPSVFDPPANPMVYPNTNGIYFTNACSFKCGGINFVDNAKAAMGSVEIKLDGLVDNGDGTNSQLQFKKYMTFSYSP